MYKIVTLTDKLHPVINCLFKEVVNELDLAEVRGSHNIKILEVPSILVRVDPSDGELIIIDGHHRAYEAAKRGVYIRCAVVESPHESVENYEGGIGGCLFEYGLSVRPKLASKYGSVLSLRVEYDRSKEADKWSDELWSLLD